jgi:hypothetical protein
MRFSKPIFSLLILNFTFGVSVCAVAADNQTSPVSNTKYQLQGGLFSDNAAGPGQFGLPVLSLTDSVKARRIGQTRIGINLDASVCFTMRSYRVKRTERLANNEHGLTGYSTCEMGSSFRLRSADDAAPAKAK